MRWLTTPVAAVAVGAVAAAAIWTVAAMATVDNEDNVQWWQWGGSSMTAAAFDDNGDGLWIGKQGEDGG